MDTNVAHPLCLALRPLFLFTTHTGRITFASFVLGEFGGRLTTDGLPQVLRCALLLHVQINLVCGHDFTNWCRFIALSLDIIIYVVIEVIEELGVLNASMTKLVIISPLLYLKIVPDGRSFIATLLAHVVLLKSSHAVSCHTDLVVSMSLAHVVDIALVLRTVLTALRLGGVRPRFYRHGTSLLGKLIGVHR